MSGIPEGFIVNGGLSNYSVEDSFNTLVSVCLKNRSDRAKATFSPSDEQRNNVAAAI